MFLLNVGKHCRAALTMGVLLLVTPAARAANVTWLSTGTDMNSGTAAWSTAPGTADYGNFAVAGTGTNPYLTTNLTMGGLFFNSAASSGWTVSGNSDATLTLTASGQSAGSTTNGSAALSSNATSGTNTITANLFLSSTTGTAAINVASGGVLWLAGNVSGTTLRAFATGGTVVLSGSNSLSGRYLATQANTLLLNSAYALGVGGGLELSNGSGFTIDSASGSALTLAGSHNLYFTSGGAQTLTFVGTNDLNLGSGTAVLTNASKTISTTAGKLTIGSIDVSGASSATYGLTKLGAGTLAITGSAGLSYAGGFTLTTGILQVGNNTALGTGTLSIGNAATVQAINGDRVLPNPWVFTATTGGNVFSGSQSLTINGMGKYSANAATASLTNNIDAGKVLTFQGGLDIYSGTAATAGTFTLAGSGNTTISGNLIQSTGSARNFTITNTGITTFSGSNTYMGTTTVSGGVLKLDSANALGSGNLTIGTNGIVGLGIGNSSFTRAAGLGTGQVQWNGGGFAAYGADATVDIGGVGASGTVSLSNNSLWSAATADKTVIMANTLNLSTAVKTVTVNNGSADVDAKFTAGLFGSGAGNFIKAGAGTLELTAASTYSGTTVITAGQLRFSGTGSLSGTTGRVVVNGSDAELKWNSSVALSRPITFTQGILSGTGTIGTAVSVGSGAVLSPGNSPGTQAFTSGLTWLSGGTYDWEINDATATLGGNPGWDLLDVTGGTLNLASLTPGSFTLDLITLNSLVSGSMANYTPGQQYTWQIVRTLAGGVVTPTGTATGGEDLTSLFTLVTTNWASGPAPSTIQVKVSSGGTGLDLVIVPEPETLALAGIGTFMACWTLWKRRRIATMCDHHSRA